MIIIVDYGVGNLGSVLNMFRYLGVPANVSSCLSVINKASKLLFQVLVLLIVQFHG